MGHVYGPQKTQALSSLNDSYQEYAIFIMQPFFSSKLTFVLSQTESH